MKDDSHNPLSRREFLQKLGAFGAAGLVAPYIPASFQTQRSSTEVEHESKMPIDHVIISCQENRTFDTYFGFYPRAGRFGVPKGYSQPDGSGGRVKPFHSTSYCTHDISHSWQSIHSEWDQGRMDGFYTTDGQPAMAYYDAQDLPYYYALADNFTLCGNYFCSLLGPTLPNRLYLWSGTSGGNTTNNLVPGTLDWPTIVDLLDAHGITWKCYNVGVGSGAGSAPDPTDGIFFNPLAYFKKWAKDPRLFYQEADYYADLAAGTLPQVSWIITESFYSEHPPANIQWGQKKMSELISGLMQSSSWMRSAFFLTYDEGGGYFEHVAPPKLDAYGEGFRVPTVVVSPWAKRGYIAPQRYEHGSILRFIERRFDLPTLASVNHQFDHQTPAQNNDAASGAFGPPAPPRDRLESIGDMTGVFNFKQNPGYRPRLPVAQFNEHSGDAQCVASAYKWAV